MKGLIFIENLIGVYFIVNRTNNKFYVGHSSNIYKRFIAHKSYLRRNIHHCIFLQRAWNKHGESNFDFRVFKICNTIDESILLEQKFIDHCKILYNTSKDANFGGDLISNHPNRTEIIDKIKKSSILYMSTLSSEERAFKFGQPGESNPMFGKNHSEETKNIISIKNRGSSPSNKGKSLEETVGIERATEIKKILSNNAKSKIGDKNPFFNKSHSDKTKQHLSEKMKGRKPVNMKKVIIDNIIYESVTDASRNLSVCPATVIFRIKSKSNNFKSYNYVE
ncbi:GIY-YIG nuclease family protein [Clostridium gasigenes]|uniref:NUMOD3 domain-containing DNA-binding protein n=2 Tax=Clostridium gasigenes TaxID=94869 RepID=UPI0016237050|nr:NUMOD3 domain-containing DNA-binding protein [Clostridium gasigenes]MBB6624911.1 GIY-YIG nuclease family protein [Clostridium gasigenes]